RLGTETAVECRLPGAGLGGWEVNLPTEPLKHTAHAHPDLGKDLIHQSCDKQRYFHTFLIEPDLLGIKKQRKELSAHRRTGRDRSDTLERRHIRRRPYAIPKHVDHGCPARAGASVLVR